MHPVFAVRRKPYGTNFYRLGGRIGIMYGVWLGTSTP